MHAPRAGAGDPRRIVLACTMRNEGPYVLEWVAYHRSIGFTDLVVCTNDCVDGSPDLLDALQDAGVLTGKEPAPTASGRPRAKAKPRKRKV